ncbi:MAG: SGNH/GDSL hydrolase family protein [Clostridia bacterium]|nr:SGNH/GDSL hydrolase family protein [Clostridia bacterium]
MKFFETYTSNSLAPSSNQSWFSNEGKCISRSFYKVYLGGKFEYSFLFSNIIYSTFADGSHSQVNLKCDEWEILSLKALVVDAKTHDFSNPKIVREYQLTFDSKISKVMQAEGEFYTDGMVINAEKDDYICLEMEFKGDGKMPYFEEILIPSYRFIDGKWIKNNKTPLANMIGIKRQVSKKIGFLGDSITEGCGTENNSYDAWCAQIAEKSSDENSYWNLGIGFGRADDIATDGIWLDRAKNLDIVTVCIGVNDICQGFSAWKIKDNITKIVKILRENNVRVILFTVPPFDWDEEKTKKWNEVNDYINRRLSKKVEIFDTVSILGQNEPNQNLSRYGGHPNKEGCEALANAFVDKKYF